MIACAAACEPSIDEHPSIVTAPRVLAVRADPPEAAPLAAVALTALWADPAGSSGAPPIAWAFCDARKPLAELGPVSSACIARDGDQFEPFGAGERASDAIPQKACRRFGPEVPEATNDQPPGRPVDPDTTGGYYQPVRLAVSTAAGDDFTIARLRLSCGVAGASSDQLADLAARSHPNANPEIAAVTADGAPLDPLAPAHSTAAGRAMHLSAAWAACAPGAPSCPGAELYAIYDVGARQVVTHREGMRVSWYATDGAFGAERTGRDELDPATTSENDWTAPDRSGPVRFWIVLSDDRGGTAWSTFTVDVR